MFPVGGPEQRAYVGGMAEWPQALVGKAEIVAFLLFLAQPNPSQSVPRISRWHPQRVTAIHGFLIGIAASMRNPSAVARTENRLQRGHEAARRHNHFQRAPLSGVGIRFAVRHHEQTTF